MVLAETQITPDRLGLGLTLRWSPGGGPFASGRRSRSSKRSLLAGAGEVRVGAVDGQPKQQASSTALRPEGHDRGAIGRNRRIVVLRYGGPEVMTVVEEPIPEPRPRASRPWARPRSTTPRGASWSASASAR